MKEIGNPKPFERDILQNENMLHRQSNCTSSITSHTLRILCHVVRTVDRCNIPNHGDFFECIYAYDIISSHFKNDG